MLYQNWVVKSQHLGKKVVQRAKNHNYIDAEDNATLMSTSTATTASCEQEDVTVPPYISTSS